MTALKAGISYFAVVFASGFVLGAFRVLVLAPSVGETGALAIELPVMLALSWIVCLWLVRAQEVPESTAARVVMGASAFVLLMAAEAALAVIVFGRSLMQHLAGFRVANAQIGLVAQAAFAAFPLIQLWLARRGRA